ncbi:hypothetical protein Tco_0500201 [Tanacetum coccineum]
MGTPTLVCVWSCPNFSALAGRPFLSDIWLLISGDAMGVTDWKSELRIYVHGVMLLLAFACLRFGTLVMSVIEMCELNIEKGTGVLVGRGGRGRRPGDGNDERADDLNGYGNNQGLRSNGGIEGVNGNVKGVNKGLGGAPDFPMIIAQQLQNLLPTMLAQVGNQGNVRNQNDDVVNENEYDGKRGDVVLTRWIEKKESMQDMSGCSVNQKVKYTADLFVEFFPSHEMQKLETMLWNHAMVRAGHAAHTDRMVAVIEPKTIQKAVQIYSTQTDEAVRNGSNLNFVCPFGFILMHRF